MTTSGRALFDGDNIFTALSAALKRLRRRMQVVLQDSYKAFSPRFMVNEIIAEAWRIHPETLSRDVWQLRTAELLEQVGLRAA